MSRTKGILLRVGIDSTKKSGEWRAPCRSDGRFAYVPIQAGDECSDRGAYFDHAYSEFAPFAKQIDNRPWPAHLCGACHLDPDFSHLTYGDYGKKGQRIREALSEGDFLVFWAGFHCVEEDAVICSIIGFYEVACIRNAIDVVPLDCHRNAHTRFSTNPKDRHMVVFANPAKSGRLKRHIPIGSRREGSQRVDSALLRRWGDLSKKDGRDWPDGNIQRGMPPNFRNPEKFLTWFYDQKPEFVHANNI